MAEQWTGERVERLEKLWHAGWSAAKIAVDFGAFSRSAVLGKVHRLGLPSRERPAACPRPMPKPRTERIKPRDPRPLEILARKATPPQPEYVCVSIDELKPHHCRFPLGDSPVMYCGQQKIENSSYCAYCHSVCYRLSV